MTGFKGLAQSTYAVSLGCLVAAVPAPAFAQQAPQGEVESLRAELAQARQQIADQSQKLAEQQRRLDLFEQRLQGLAQTTQQIRNDALAAAAPAAATVAASGASQATRVGEPPKDSDRPPAVAVLDQQGSVVTRKGEFVAELGLDYTRADRNRALFRGTGIVNTVLVGVFDINEVQQDSITESVSARYGILDRLEIGARLPVVIRSDRQVTVPLQDGNATQPGAQLITNRTTASAKGIGDVEINARYQLNKGGGGKPFLIVGLSGVIPTGNSPYAVPRNKLGLPIKAATGAGFYTISPSFTAILPSEPAVLFGTISYARNFARNVDTRISGVQILRVDPGDQIAFAGGIGLALNDRTSLNLGYSHAWVFGTKTTRRALDGNTNEPVGDFIRVKSRDLQVGRLLVGVSQKITDKLQVNWSFEIGATEDAPDVRTSLRIPIRF